jgi:hypothetical protein
MIKAARDHAKAQVPPTPASKALEKYCSLGASLSTEEQQFCYNTENVRGDLNRLLDMGADESRVCKKVRAMNPDFCVSKSSRRATTDGNAAKDAKSPSSSTASGGDRTRSKRGIIYI